MNESPYPPGFEPLGYRESRAPLGRVTDKEGLSFFSPLVHAITAWAEVGEDTWLATLVGIKRVSRNPETPPRHYSTVDGLPGLHASAIVADEQGAYTLIDLGAEEALCAWNASTDTWETLTRWQKWADPRTGMGIQPGLLALGKDVVVGTTGTVYTDSASVLPCFARGTHEPLTIPWDNGIQADHETLTIGFLACRESAIALGTSIGWIEVPLFSEGGHWVRRLADRHVHYGVEGEGGLYLWLSTRRREESYLFQAGICRVDTKTWQPALLPNVMPYLEPMPGIVDDKGDLWLAVRPREQPGMPYGSTGQAALKHWNQAESRWVELTDEGEAPGPSNPNIRSVPLNELPAVASEAVIPETPARLLALTQTHPGHSPGVSARALRWLRGRFPHWLSPDATEELPPPLKQASFEVTLPAIAEPGAPQRVWLGVPGQLMCVSASLFQAFSLLPAQGSNRPLNCSFSPDFATLERVTVPETPAPVSASLFHMLALPEERFFAMGINSRALVISEQGRHWQELAGTQAFNQDEVAFLTESKKNLLVHIPGDPTLSRVDLEAGQLVTTSILRPGHLFLGVNTQGAWWLKNRDGIELQVLEPGSDQARPITPRFPAEFRPGKALGMSGVWLWWFGMQGGQVATYGWNSVENRISPPFAKLQRNPETAPVPDDQGGFYAVSWEKLYHWAAGSDSWEPVAALEDNKLALIAQDAGAFYLFNPTELIRIDRETGASHTYPFPGAVYINRDPFCITPEAIFLLATYSLYRFDRKRRVWESWQRSATASNLTPQVMASDRSGIWGAMTLQYQQGSIIFRFSPTTHQFTLFDKSAGLTDVSIPRIVMNQQEPWVLCQQGAYRFDAATRRFTQELTINVQSIAISGDGNDVWLVARLGFKESSLYHWNRARNTTRQVTDSSWSQCFDVICQGSDTIITTDHGLYRWERNGTWVPINSAGIVANQLHPGTGNSVWASGDNGILHLHPTE